MGRLVAWSPLEHGQGHACWRGASRALFVWVVRARATTACRSRSPEIDRDSRVVNKSIGERD